jgi:hypothetical protein
VHYSFQNVCELAIELSWAVNEAVLCKIAPAGTQGSTVCSQSHCTLWCFVYNV